MNLEDPLQRYSGLSLLHRSLGSLSKPPCDPDPHHDDDLLSAHNFLKSLPVKNSDKLIEQAKSILDATSGLVNADLPNDAMPEDKFEVGVQKAAESPWARRPGLGRKRVQKAAESPRARRPGLGRKRARFSLIHNSSQPSVILEPTLDMDNLKDPEQFFLAFERLEDAKKEMAKQTGHVSIRSNQSSMEMAPRPRRPGMPGRSRTVKYQHLYPTMSFQETSIEVILSPSNPGSQQETVSQAVAIQLTESTSVSLEESELAGEWLLLQEQASMAKAEKRVDKLLDELLACDCEELDGDGAVTLLQDRLKVKSLDIEKLNLPELPYVQRTNLNALGGNLPKPRNVLSHIHNLPRRTLTPMKQQIAGNSTSSFGSPTPPKSQLASLALLRKHILQSNPSTNPVLKSLIIEEDDTTAGNSSTTEVAVKALNDNLTSLGSGSDVCPSKSSAEVENSNVGVDNGITYEYLSQLGGDADVQNNGPNELEDMVEDIQQKAVDKSLNSNLSSLGSDENSSLHGGDVDIQTNRRNELEDMVSLVFTGLCFAICFALKLLIRILPHEVLHLHSLKTQPWSF
ncbi:hypothetical protein POTOM_060991 [Populus tomentosa]|uniref:Uncharacterized protein n=1 Tax=Populus tomentosa TaxID=118781 RepID=A0A8X7XSQ1_POPTO|nr:hypothetical protein POTOM_060991 [Populus tomentosa]